MLLGRCLCRCGCHFFTFSDGKFFLFEFLNDDIQRCLCIVEGDGDGLLFIVGGKVLYAFSGFQDKTYPGFSRSGPAPVDLELIGAFRRKGGARRDEHHDTDKTKYQSNTVFLHCCSLGVKCVHQC